VGRMADNGAMTDRARRRELREQIAAHPPDAGVYAIRHRATGRVIVASAVNLAGARNRFDFAVATGTHSALDGQLGGDIAAHGPEGLAFEVLETVTVEPGTPDADLRADLATLEALWREQLGAGRDHRTS
jgi:broad specificity phosphatase PhoE